MKSHVDAHYYFVQSEGQSCFETGNERNCAIKWDFSGVVETLRAQYTLKLNCAV